VARAQYRQAEGDEDAAQHQDGEHEERLRERTEALSKVTPTDPHAALQRCSPAPWVVLIIPKQGKQPFHPFQLTEG
jgi:hypothetical protein